MANDKLFLDDTVSGATKEVIDDFLSSTYGMYKGDVIGTEVLRKCSRFVCM